MEFRIISRKAFPLLSRERVNVETTFQNMPTPKKDDIKKALSSFLKAEENLLSIRHIYTNFGESKAKIIANIYNNAANLELLEKKKVKKEKKAKAAKQAK